MLSMIDIADKKECRIDIDYYVPFNISKLKHEFNKERKEFQVILTESYILVSFNSTFNIETIVKMNKIEIGFGISNDISLIRINNITHEEYVDLRNSFKL